MNGWIWESMNEWLDNNDKNGWMDCWMTMIRMEEWMVGWLWYEWINGWSQNNKKNGWMDGRMTMIRMDGWMVGWIL